MLKQELIKTIRSPRGIAVFLFLLFVSIGDNILGLLQTGENGGLYEIHPAYLSLLSGQSGMVFYALFIWIMPILLMLLYCGRYSDEKKRNITNVYLTKAKRKTVFFSKIGTAFLLPAVFWGVPLLLNLFVSVLFLHGGTSFLGFESMTKESLGAYLYFGIQHPYIAWIGYFFAALFIFGLLGILCQSVSIILNDNKIAYIVSFAIWISLFSSKYNITMMIQPYTEYDYAFALKTFLLFCPFVIAAFIMAYITMVVKKDAV